MDFGCISKKNAKIEMKLNTETTRKIQKFCTQKMTKEFQRKGVPLNLK